MRNTAVLLGVAVLAQGCLVTAVLPPESHRVPGEELEGTWSCRDASDKEWVSTITTRPDGWSIYQSSNVEWEQELLADGNQDWTPHVEVGDPWKFALYKFDKLHYLIGAPDAPSCDCMVDGYMIAAAEVKGSKATILTANEETLKAGVQSGDVDVLVSENNVWLLKYDAEELAAFLSQPKTHKLLGDKKEGKMTCVQIAGRYAPARED
ncbi:MAG: hypothetical protein H6739_20935 [Alphaproteobacteria bacterium]|nr:hypothetical protein [Alphaproteobacteria bacterium]